jgi:hypothetical protein
MKLPQFTLRDLLWLMLVIGLALGWWRQARREEFAKENLCTYFIMADGDFDEMFERRLYSKGVVENRRKLKTERRSRTYAPAKQN